MKTTSPRTANPIIGVVCSTFGHKYVVTRKITNHINEYRCSHCKKEVTENLTGSLEALTLKTKKVNSVVSSFFQKRAERTLA
ncbi:hypothetical protein [Ulvibacter antarcticus]|uniref:Prophage protein DUF1660 n=1 Tax=Ulvibacter antarcticus TaxID=442714 RepID=A0A3L9Z6B4_9FLAO|nr:hypothetical protein [Ulvibacter antarcticus]RMA65815.1 hypothetical protein BXY75_0228 [Ulvibacter antarcticus]